MELSLDSFLVIGFLNVTKLPCMWSDQQRGNFCIKIPEPKL